ncbi:SDR family NAD(P)-dependent oxidoreductase [Bradyrhizobium sp. CB1717]|uniref:SDR family NAD(P)-dependent oxidoreductase n=1 Tax=Bradyrhizobium sp. CB1717 TaxID=3039154 RepID=UPI0024B14DE5|nr:SDR family oxidoreductase [Bradyrhizobium sp. CB1717]WFU25155.1 SDR family NAD(P)-dependent oxidoreductase [Bradyrhizobium sp. CB1717]
MEEGEGYVLVTGASRGVGAGAALELARSGFDLVLWARTGGELAKTAERCRAFGVDARTAIVDVSNEASVNEAGAASLVDLDSLRGCVVNAGIGIWGTVTETKPDEWRAVMSTNLDGAFYTMKACLPLIERHDRGQIVIMGSDSGRFGFAGRAAYCASKWGLNGFVESLRRETRSSGIRITNLTMSRVDTFFRTKQPGDRPSSLSIQEISEVVRLVFLVPARVEMRELQLSSINDTFGPYPEQN